MKNKCKLQLLRIWLVWVLLPCACTGPAEKEVVVQAHRGGEALFPGNTILAMINAVKIGTRTLEFDLRLTPDSLVVVSHAACSPDATDPKAALPTLTNLIDCVETYTCSRGIEPVNYNIRITTTDLSDYKAICDLSLRVLVKKNLKKRLCIQSADPRSLNYIHLNYPYVALSYVIENDARSVSELLRQLDFVPKMISPKHCLVNERFVSDAHGYQMKVVPWIVDQKDEVLRLKKLNVDEIITNKPDSVRLWLAMDSPRKRYTEAFAFFEHSMGY